MPNNQIQIGSNHNSNWEDYCQSSVGRRIGSGMQIMAFFKKSSPRKVMYNFIQNNNFQVSQLRMNENFIESDFR